MKEISQKRYKFENAFRIKMKKIILNMYRNDLDIDSSLLFALKKHITKKQCFRLFITCVVH